MSGVSDYFGIQLLASLSPLKEGRGELTYLSFCSFIHLVIHPSPFCSLYFVVLLNKQTSSSHVARDNGC